MWIVEGAGVFVVIGSEVNGRGIFSLDVDHHPVREVLTILEGVPIIVI